MSLIFDFELSERVWDPEGVSGVRPSGQHFLRKKAAGLNQQTKLIRLPLQTAA